MIQAPHYITGKARRFVGFTIRTRNADEDGVEGRIPGLWADFMSRYSEFSTEAAPIAVYYDYESDHEGQYSLLVGVPYTDKGQVIPLGATVVDVPGAEYLQFKVEEPGPMGIVLTWQAIWDYFANAPQMPRAYTMDLELHGNPTVINISVLKA